MSEITTDGDVQVKFRHNGQSGVTSLGLLKISKHGIRYVLPGDDNKRDPERENLAVLTIAAQTANVIHIRVTFNVVTR